jgi:DNA-binding Lrp family transcriptional regulator
MAHISFALLEALIGGASTAEIAERLQLPEPWVQERIEAARLCLVLPADVAALGLK